MPVELDPATQDRIHAALLLGMNIGIFIGWLIGTFTVLVLQHRQDMRALRQQELKKSG